MMYWPALWWVWVWWFGVWREFSVGGLGLLGGGWGFVVCVAGRRVLRLEACLGVAVLSLGLLGWVRGRTGDWPRLG